MRPALLLIFVPLVSCGTTAGRLRFVSSQATQASWSFVIDDRARGAEVLVDGRFRDDGCERAGHVIRCELRGLFPGGHTLEVRLPAAVLKRTVILGQAWAARPVLVTARDADEATAAAKAGADGVVADAAALDPVELIEAAHKQGARALVHDPDLIETGGADGLVGLALTADQQRRFPEARSYMIDQTASGAVTVFAGGGEATALRSALERSTGLVSATGLVGDAAALTAPHGALVDKAALPMLKGRRHHAALREGKPQDEKSDGPRYSVTLVSGGDAATLLINAGKEPWQVQPTLPTAPLDLLGSTLDGATLTIAPHDVALLVHLPEKDKTRY